MINNIENNTRIRLVGGNGLRSIAEHSIDEQSVIHCLAKVEPVGEPILPFDFRLYRLALEVDAGVAKKDAKVTVKELRKKYEEGNNSQKQRIEGVMWNAWEGIMVRNQALEPVRIFESIPVNQEVALYTRVR